MIGAGGFAWVYRGWDAELDIPVAIKILKPHFAGDAAFEERFRQEAAMAAKLRHPNIVRILGGGREGDAVFFAMDYVPHSLAERLRATPTLPELVVAQVGMDVAAALAFAHSEGVIHRDIKVDNILFDEHGNAIVADFGIARAVSGYTQQTGTNMVVGTPQYFSPEQARGSQIDGRSDIYSLGVTMYRAVTGRLPFEGEDWYEIARKQIEDEPPALRSINPAVSLELERVILKCLAKKPDDRFTTAQGLRAELARISGIASSGEQTVVMPVERMRWRRGTGAGSGARQRLFVASAVSVAGVILLAAIARGRADGSPPVSLVTRRTVDSVAGVSPPVSVGAAADADSSMPPPKSRTASAVVPVRRAAPPRGKLNVFAPSGASILVAGPAPRSEQWQPSDSLPPGTYLVSASVPSSPGCTSASLSEHVSIAAGKGNNVTLRPVGCGLWDLLGPPPGAHYRIVRQGGGFQHNDTMPMPGPLLLPEGTYQLDVVMWSKCKPYSGQSRIQADSTLHQRLLLVCSEPPQ